MTDASTSSAEELREAWRAVANAKLVEFRKQCWRLAALVRSGIVEKQAAVDRLWEIALAYALVRALGEERVEAILIEAFADVFCGPCIRNRSHDRSEAPVHLGSVRPHHPR